MKTSENLLSKEYSFHKLFFFLLIVFTIFASTTKRDIGLAYLVNIFMLLLWIYIFFQGKIHFKVDFVSKSIFFVLITFSISLLLNINISSKFYHNYFKIILDFLSVIAPFILFFIISSIPFTMEQIKKVVFVFSGLTLIAMLFKLIVYLNTPIYTMDIGHRFRIFHLHPNHTAEQISMICILIYAALSFEKKKTLLFLKIILLLVAFFTLFLTFSRGAWLGIICSILFLCFLNIKNKATLITTIMLFCISITIFISVPSFSNRFQSIPSVTNTSNAERIQLWNTSFKIIQQNPWFQLGPNKLIGIGPKLYESYSKLYQKAPYYGSCHNNFLNILVEGGLFGFGAYCIMILLIFIKSFQMWRKATNELRYLLTVFMGWLILWNVHGFVDYTFSFNVTLVIFLLFAMLIAYEKYTLNPQMTNKSKE